MVAADRIGAVTGDDTGEIKVGKFRSRYLTKYKYKCVLYLCIGQGMVRTDTNLYRYEHLTLTNYLTWYLIR